MYEPQKRDDTAADDEGELSPEQAAQLIEQTSREAKRQFGYWQSPWYTLAARSSGWPSTARSGSRCAGSTPTRGRQAGPC